MSKLLLIIILKNKNYSYYKNKSYKTVYDSKNSDIKEKLEELFLQECGSATK